MAKKLARKVAKKAPYDLAAITVAEGKKLYVKAKEAYYNTGKPIMSDAAFDALEGWLNKKAPKWSGLKKIGAPAPKALKKVKLPHFMASLDKVKPDGSAAKWLKDVKGKATLSAKKDGYSVALQADKTGKVRLFTRGDGSVGSDISHLIPLIPSLQGRLKPLQAVRGEMVLPTAAFNKHFARKTKADKDGFSNPRNAVSSVINAKAPNPAMVKHIEFVVHSQMHPAKALHEAAPALTKAGFTVVEHHVVPAKSLTEDKLAALVPQWRKNDRHEIDGIVIHRHDTGDIRAFKAEDEQKTFTVERVEWKHGRSGRLTPVVWFSDPKTLEGVQVKKATGKNAALIVSKGIGPGAVVTVARSGQVIPDIRTVVKKAKSPGLPPSGTWRWDDNHTFILAVEHGHAQAARQLEHFLVKAGIENAKHTMLEKLTRAGIDTIDKLLKASPTTLKAAGFGPKQITSLQTQMKDKLSSVGEADLMAGSGVFPSGWGSRLFTMVLNEIPLAKLRKMKPAAIGKAVGAIEGMGAKRSAQFAEALPKYFVFERTTGLKAKPREQASAKLKGLKFTFSGFRDKALTKAIEDAGGSYSDSMTKKTTHVVFRSKEVMSGKKFSQAVAAGAQTITIDDLKHML